MADDQQTPEPRSAVQAAGSPAHGGGQEPDTASFEATGQYVGYQAGQGQAMATDYPYQGPMQGSASAFGQSLNDQPRSRTITSGIARLRDVANKAGSVLSEGASLVRTLEGSAEEGDAGQGKAAGTAKPGTVDALHDAVSDVETLVSAFGSLLARVKAAHG